MGGMNSQAKSRLSYFISYGFLGGKPHSKHMRQLLEARGFVPASSMQAADIIVAHSAGCWLLKDFMRAKLILLVGMPLQHGHTARMFMKANKANGQVFWRNHHLWHGMRIFFWSTAYGILQPRRNIRIVHSTNKRTNAFPIFSPKQQVVFVANHFDPWPHSPELRELVASQPFAFLSMPDSHDNIWEMPGYYVEVLEHYAK